MKEERFRGREIWNILTAREILNINKTITGQDLAKVNVYKKSEKYLDIYETSA